MPRFTIIHDGQVERSLTLLLDEIRIGRLPESEIVLPQASVSRRHARIRREGGRFLVEDLGSMNGVHFAGRRIMKAELAPGDRLRIEDYEIVFEPPEPLYQAGLLKQAPVPASQHAFGMTYLSAGSFTAGAKNGRG